MNITARKRLENDEGNITIYCKDMGDMKWKKSMQIEFKKKLN